MHEPVTGQGTFQNKFHTLHEYPHQEETHKGPSFTLSSFSQKKKKISRLLINLRNWTFLNIHTTLQKTLEMMSEFILSFLFFCF